jgi:hypothetical protein
MTQEVTMTANQLSELVFGKGFYIVDIKEDIIGNKKVYIISKYDRK